MKFEMKMWLKHVIHQKLSTDCALSIKDNWSSEIVKERVGTDINRVVAFDSAWLNEMIQNGLDWKHQQTCILTHLFFYIYLGSYIQRAIFKLSPFWIIDVTLVLVCFKICLLCSKLKPSRHSLLGKQQHGAVHSSWNLVMSFHYVLYSLRKNQYEDSSVWFSIWGQCRVFEKNWRSPLVIT